MKKSLKLTGTVSPSAAPGRVTIVMTRLVAKKWKASGSASASVVGGAFTYSFKPALKGSWRFVAKYSGGAVGTTTYKASKSAVKGVTVKWGRTPSRSRLVACADDPSRASIDRIRWDTAIGRNPLSHRCIGRFRGVPGGQGVAAEAPRSAGSIPGESPICAALAGTLQQE